MSVKLILQRMGVGWAPICHLKEAKNLYGLAHLFQGVGVHLLIHMETYTSYTSMSGVSVSLLNPPLWMIFFCG